MVPLRTLGLSALLWVGVLDAAAQAKSTCSFVRRGDTLRMLADCQTDETLFIPAGATLDGAGHRLRAVDPPGGAFSGAVIRNAGDEAHLKNLVIDAAGLAAVCHPITPEDTRLRAVLFSGASGTITDNRIVAINQGASSCQEGAGIEVRADAVSPTPRVLIRGNEVRNYQKTGIFVEGPIDAGIYFNRVEGEGPVDYIAQNGIHVTNAARGAIKFNHVSGTVYTGTEVSSTGILAVDCSAPLEIEANTVTETDVAIRLTRVRGAEVAGNFITVATYDGITLNGRDGPTTGNHIVANRITGCDVGIDLFGEGAADNLVTGNVVTFSGSAAIQETLGATQNRIFHNYLGRGELVGDAPETATQL